MILREAINNFLSHLRRSGYSTRTVKAYAFDLNKFAFFINSDTEFDETKLPIKSIDKSLVRDWADHCLEKGNTSKTLARKMATCKSFFKFLVREELIEVNPLDNLALPKTPKKLPKSISQDDIRQLMAAPEEDEKNFFRDRAILLLMYSAGLRVSEIVKLRIQCVSVEQAAVRVEGKGAKERVLPLSDSSRRSLIDYFEYREKIMPDTMFPKAPAFITPAGKEMSVRMIQYMVEKYGKRAGILTHLHPHLIRHSIASHLVDEGCHIEAIRQTLGHEDLKTTSVYLKTSSRFLKNEHKKFNPADRLTGKGDKT